MMSAILFLSLPATKHSHRLAACESYLHTPADSAALDDVDLRQRFIRYSLQSPPPDVPHGQLAATVIAVLGLAPVEAVSGTAPGPLQRPWCTETTVADVDTQLQELLRGEYIAVSSSAVCNMCLHMCRRAHARRGCS